MNTFFTVRSAQRLMALVSIFSLIFTLMYGGVGSHHVSAFEGTEDIQIHQEDASDFEKHNNEQQGEREGDEENDSDDTQNHSHDDSCTGMTSHFSSDDKWGGENNEDCTEHSDRKGSITIVKTVAGTEVPSVWSFVLDGYVFGDFSVSNTNPTKVFSNLNAGVYTFGEYIPPHWDVTNVTCNDSDSGIPVPGPGAPLIVHLGSGEQVSCTFTNTYTPPEETLCDDDSATNYDEVGECVYDHGDGVVGCMDETATNYNAEATIEGECTYDHGDGIVGCMDDTATNYDSEATVAGECTYDQGSNEDTYLVFGYVWNDKNKNTIEDENEDHLKTWTVTITNGETLFETTTDERGYYEFHVPSGTWTITENAPSSHWHPTFPVTENHTHVVTVPGAAALSTQGSVMAQIRNFFVPIAFAQTAGFGPFNFGNKFSGSSGSGSSAHHSATSTSGLGGAFPVGEVLGASTTTLPVGAPNTGAGGTSPVIINLPSFLAVLSSRTSVRRLKNA